MEVNMDTTKVRIQFQPNITDDQLWDFYVRNDICEVGYGKKLAVLPLHNPCVVVGAFFEDSLVGYVRALFDGLGADIVEFCLENELQGADLQYENGSLIEKDTYGIGKQMGNLLIDELRKMGSTWISVYIVEDCEEMFYSSIGLTENKNHKVYHLDERSYLK